MKLLAGAIGLALVLAGISIRPSGDTLRPDEAKAAFTRLADKSLLFSKAGQSTELKATVPNDNTWRRIRRLWGDPEYFVAAMSPSSRNYMYCLDQLGLAVQVTLDGNPVQLETADSPPYGYSTNCRPVGVKFAAAPGAHVQISVTGRPNRTGDDVHVVVEPYWTEGTKDHFVGIGIEEQFHLEALWRVLVILGAALVIYGYWNVLKRRVPRQQSLI